MVTSVVAEVFVLEFIGVGLGDIENLGKNSAIGRWISKTKGGRALFKDIKEVPKRLRSIQSHKLQKGVATPRKARKVAYLERLIGNKSAYQIAKERGKHPGTYKNYLNKSPGELEKSIRLYKRQVTRHENLIKDPAKYLKGYGKEIKGEP